MSKHLSNKILVTNYFNEGTRALSLAIFGRNERYGAGYKILILWLHIKAGLVF